MRELKRNRLTSDDSAVDRWTFFWVVARRRDLAGRDGGRRRESKDAAVLNTGVLT